MSEQQFRKVYAIVQTKHGPTREGLWGLPVTKDTVEILNIPHLSDKIGLHDVVRVNESGEIVEVLKEVTYTCHATYDAVADRQEALRQWQLISEHFRPLGVECESAVPGLFGLAVPLQVPEADLLDLAAKCPVPLTQIGGIKE